jgi:hypothetical protein
MECGDVTPLLFLFLFLSFYGVRCFDTAFVSSLAWQWAQKKREKQEKQRNKSGVTSPHSIKSATAKLVSRRFP